MCTRDIHLNIKKMIISIVDSPHLLAFPFLNILLAYMKKVYSKNLYSIFGQQNFL